MRVVTRVVASRRAERLAADDAFQTLDGKWSPAEITLEDGMVNRLPTGKVEKRLAVSPTARENVPASVQYSAMSRRMALGSLVIVSTVTVVGMFVTLEDPRGRVDDATDGPGLSCGERVNRILFALSRTQYALVAATRASKVAGSPCAVLSDRTEAGRERTPSRRSRILEMHDLRKSTMHQGGPK